MSAEKIISDWKKKSFKPVYWLEGEEDYYIDQVMDIVIFGPIEKGFFLAGCD